MSFRYKIALTIFLLEVVVVFTVLWRSLVYLEDSLQHQIDQSNEILMKAIVEYSAREAVITEDFGPLQFELEEIAREPNVREVLLMDVNSRVLASSNAGRIGQQFAPQDSSRQDGTGQDSARRASAETWVVKDIAGSGNVIGRVAYLFSDQGVHDATAKALRFGIAMAIGGMLVVAAAGVAIGSLLAQRLEKISRSIEFIKHGEAEKFEVDHANDEVGRLSRFIYDMTVELSSKVQQLQVGRERNRMALEVAGAGTWSWDIINNEFNWSAKYYQSLGLIPDSAKPSYKLWASRLHPDDRKRVEKAVGDMMRNFTDLDIEFRIVRPTGEVRWMHNVARVQLDHNDKPVEIYGLQIDITRFKQMADKKTNSIKEN